jgi:RNA polymerase sigma-70 factor (ECF subfamily)
MVRISVDRKAAPGLARVTIEGRLTGEKMEQLSQVLDGLRAERKRLLVDLGGVAFADAKAVTQLRRLPGVDTELIELSPYLREALAADVDADPEALEEAHPSDGRDDDEGALVAALRAGDEAAYETMIRRFGPRLLATARRLLRSEEEAADVLQEAYLSAFRAIQRFTGDARLSTWLHRIVVNAALMRLRQRRRKREVAIDDLLPNFDETGHFAESQRDWGTDAEKLLQRKDTRAMVRAAIDELPDTYRTVLLLRDVEDLDTETVATALGVTANAVKVRLHRARQALRTLIERGACGDGKSEPAPRHEGSTLRHRVKLTPRSSPTRT